MENSNNKISAVVYTSNTGYTKHYAEIIGKETGLSVYSYENAMKEIPPQSKIVYLGWLMAGRVVGYKKASENFDIKALCAVGMAKNGSQNEDVKKANVVPLELPVFTLQGGFDINRLKGIYKFMMLVMMKVVGKAISKKKNRTAEEDDMLDMMLHGGDRVSPENLSEFYAWLNN